MKTLIFFGFGCSFIFATSFNSCADIVDFGEEYACAVSDPVCDKHVNISINGQNVSSLTRIWKSAPEPREYEIGSTALPADYFSVISNFILSETSETPPIHAMTLFFDKEVSTTTILLEDNILGFCTYIVDNHKMFQKLYVRSGNEFSLHKELGGETGSKEFNSLGFYATHIFKRTQYCSYVIIVKEGNPKPELKNPRYRVFNRIKKYQAKYSSSGLQD